MLNWNCFLGGSFYRSSSGNRTLFLCRISFTALLDGTLFVVSIKCKKMAKSESPFFLVSLNCVLQDYSELFSLTGNNGVPNLLVFVCNCCRL